MVKYKRFKSNLCMQKDGKFEKIFLNKGNVPFECNI